jgi:quinol-cytochrome oxidoreductase complex cytochrome b subunit
VVLLILTLMMGLTDTAALRSAPTGRRSSPTSPGPGRLLVLIADFLRAGPEIGATTLARFYAIHMLLVPGLIIALIGAHLYLVVKLGTTAPPWLRAERPSAAHRSGEPAEKAYLRDETLKRRASPSSPTAV